MSTCALATDVIASIAGDIVGQNYDKEALKEELNNSQLSNDDQLKILSTTAYLLERIPVERKSELSKQLEKAVKELLNERKNMRQKTPLKCLPDVVLDKHNPSQFVKLGKKSICSTKVNAWIYSSLQSEIFAATVYNPDSKSKLIILNTEQLKESLESYRDNLLFTLSDFLRNRGIEHTALYSIDSDYISNALKVINSAAQEINKELDRQSIIDLNPYSDKDLNDLLLPLKALWTLNNFDEVVSFFTDGQILVENTLKDYFEFYSDKYSIKNEKMAHKSFEGGFSDLDAAKFMTKMLQRIIPTIPRRDGRGYLSTNDLVQVCQEFWDNVNHNLNSKFREKIKEVFASSEPISVKKAKFLDYLPLFMSEKNRWIGEAMQDYFTDYEASYLNQLATFSGTAEQKAEFENKYDFVNILLSTIRNSVPLTYISRDGKIEVKSRSHYKRSKIPVRNKMHNALLKNLREHRGNLYNPTFVSDPSKVDGLSTILDVYNEDAVKIILELTGIDLNAPTTRATIDANFAINLGIINRFITAFLEKVRTDLVAYEDSQDLEERIEAFLNNMAFDGAYVEFSDLIVEANSSAVDKILDAQRNQQPVLGTSVTISRFEENKQKFIDEVQKIDPNVRSQNVLIKYENLLSSSYTTPWNYQRENLIGERIAYRQDTVWDIGGKRIVKKALELRPSETVTTAINDEFVDAIISYGVFYNQIACVSDKVRIPLGSFNAWARLDGNITLQNATIEWLKNACRAQRRSYFSTLRTKLTKDLNALCRALGETADTLEDCIKVLELKKYADLQDAIAKCLENDLDFEFQKEIHYCVDRQGNLRFNNQLYYDIKAAENDIMIDAIYEETLKSDREFIRKHNLPITFVPDSYKGKEEEWLKTELGRNFCELIGAKTDNDKKAVAAYLRAGRLYTGTSTARIGNQKIEDILTEKYFYMRAMATEADLLIATKYSVVHDGKKGVKLSLKEMATKLRDNDWKTDYIKDASERLKVGTKRNNSLVAAYKVPELNTYAGTPAKMRIAIGEGHVTPLINYTGQTLDLDQNDGAIWTCGIWANWEDYNYPGNKFLGSKKVIGIFPSYAGIMQVKCADYRMNNALLRGAFEANNVANLKSRMSLLSLFEKMTHLKYNQGELGIFKNFITKLGSFTDGDVKLSKAIYYQFPDGIAELEGVSTVVNGNDCYIVPKWVYINSGAEVSMDVVAQSMDIARLNDKTTIERDTNGFKVTSLYDVWKVLGGKDSLDLTDDGEYAPGESSMNALSEFINECEPKAKDLVIAKYVDDTTAKANATNTNTVDRIADPGKSLLYCRVDTDRMGIQQDYTHESDDSQIPLVTQALSGIAFMGQNIETVNAAYEALGTIIEEGIAPLISKFNSPDSRYKFHLWIAQELLRSFETGSSIISNARIKVQETLLKLKDYAANKANGVELSPLCYSDGEIFYKFTSDLLVHLNKASIRQIMPGIAVIQNPSHGVIGVYEDKEGNVYTRADIIRMAYEAGLREGTPDQRLAEFLKRDTRFAYEEGEVLSANDKMNFDIGDTVEDDGGHITTIDSPMTLWKVAASKKNWKKVTYAKRDLKTMRIKWGEQLADGTVTRMQLWHTQAVKLLLLATYGKGDIDSAKEKGFDTETINAYKRILADCGNNPVRAKLEIQRYYRETLKSLGDKENPGYFKTYQDFKKKKDRVTCYNITYKAGEQIIPKVNASKQGIKHSMAYIKQRGANYFYDNISEKWDRGNIYANGHVSLILAFGPTSYCATLTLDNREIVVTDVVNKDYAFEDANIQETSDGLYIVDYSGNPLIKVPEPPQGVKYLISKSTVAKNGKDLLVVLLAPIDPNSDVDTKSTARKLINSLSNINVYYNDGGFSSVTDNNYMFGQTFNPSDVQYERIKEQLAQAMYTSFLLSNKTVSVRIPSQSFQSFLATETVAFTEGDLNDGYMNIWEMWFQGSDFDIDKAYTVMFNLDNTGKLQGLELLDYSSELALLNSLKQPFPKPNKELRLKPATDSSRTNNKEFTGGQVITEINVNGVVYPVLNIDTELKNGTFTKGDLIKAINEAYSDDAFIDTSALYKNPKAKPHFSTFNWMKLVNKYNKNFNLKEATKNKVTAALWECTSDIKNLEYATQPMDSGLVTREIDKVLEEVGTKEVTYHTDSIVTVALIQSENAVGKVDVGIAANGIKAASSLQQHYNRAMLHSIPVFVGNMPMKFIAPDGHIIKEFVLGAPANLNMSFEQFKSLLTSSLTPGQTLEKRVADNTIIKFRQAFKTGSLDQQSHPEFYNRKGKLLEYFERIKALCEQHSSLSDIEFLYETTKFEDNAADMLSVMISLATDNAKELRLAQMNCTPDLMSIPLALFTFGMDVHSVVDICVTCLGEVAKEMYRNKFDPEFKTVDVKTAINKALSLPKETRDALTNMLSVTEELRSLTSFYKINQGSASNYIEVNDFLQKLAAVKESKEGNALYTPTLRRARAVASKLLKNKSLNSDDIATIQKVILQAPNNGTYTEAQLKEFLDAMEAGESPLQLSKLFLDKDYAKNIKNYFNLISSSFNIIDVVMESKTYSALLKSLIDTCNILNKTSVKCAVANALVNNLNSSIVKQLKSKKIDAVTAYKKGIKLVDHVVVDNVLNSDFATRRYDFNIMDVKTLFNSTDLLLKGFNTDFANFNLSTAPGTAAFISIVENLIIPRLQQTYKQNAFLLNLQLKRNYDLVNKNRYDLNYEIFGKDDANQADLAAFTECIKAFEDIARKPSGLKNSAGLSLSIGEVFSVYDLIQGKMSILPMNSCIHETAVKLEDEVGNGVRKMFVEELQNLDKQIGILNGQFLPDAPTLNPDLIDKLVHILDAQIAGEAISRDNDYKIDITDSYVLSQAYSGSINSENFENIKGDVINYLNTLGINTQDSKADIYCDIASIKSVPEAAEPYKVFSLKIKYNTLDLEDTIEVKTYAEEEGDKYSYYDKVHVLDAVRNNIRTVKAEADTIDRSRPSITTTDIAEVAKLLPNGKYEDLFKQLAKPGLKYHIIFSTRPDLATAGYIRKINNESLIVLLHALLGDKPEVVMDLLLEANGYMSALDKLLAILKLIPDETITQENLLEKLSNDDFRKKFKDLPKGTETYIEHLEEFPVPEAFLQVSRLKAEEFEYALKHKDIYYNEFAMPISIKTPSDLGEGDTVTGIAIGEDYLYLGKTYNNEYTFFRISNPTDLSKAFIRHFKNLPKKLKKTRELFVSHNKNFGLLSEYAFKYEETPLTKTFDLIEVGDKVMLNGALLFVTDVIMTSEETRLVVKLGLDLRGLKESDLDNEIITYVPKLDQLLDTDSPSFTGDFSVLEYDVLRKFIGSSVTVNGQTGKLLGINPRSKYLRVFGINEEVNPQDVTIKYPKEALLDRELTMEFKLPVYVVLNRSLDICRAGLRHYAYEEEREGDNMKKITLKSPKPAHYQPVDEVKNGVQLQTGDVIFKDETSYKVLKVNADDSVLCCRLKPDGGQELCTAGISAPSTIDLTGGTIYRKIDFLSKYTPLPNPGSDTLNGDRVMYILSEKFGLDIEAVNDLNSTHFAQVKDDKIIINTALLDQYNQLHRTKLTLGLYIFVQGMHEFTHLMLTYLKSNNLNQYYALIQMGKAIFDKAINSNDLLAISINNDNSNYKTEEEKIQEYIVRRLETIYRQLAGQIKEATDMELMTRIKAMVNSGFSQMFKVGYPNTLSQSMRDVFSHMKSDFFTQSTSGLTINGIKNGLISLDEFKRIICK